MTLIFRRLTIPTLLACGIVASCSSSPDSAPSADEDGGAGGSDPALDGAVDSAVAAQDSGGQDTGDAGGCRAVPDPCALALLAKMSLDDKVNMLHGELNFNYGFFNGAIDSLGIPALTMANGPSGVGVANVNVNGGRATQLPSALALAATWSADAAQQYGALIGKEAHLTGHNVQLGPVLDLARNPRWGRVNETYGEDPLLAGTMGAASIRGIQTNPVIATLKHFIGYTQETNRLFGSDMIIDERTLQELYARSAGIAVRDGDPGAVMCSFNKVNGVSSCENNTSLDLLLKGQLGYKNWVMTDYNASFDTEPAILAGLDQDMPGNFTPDVGPGDCRFCKPLLDAVRNGDVAQSRVDDAVTRILRSMFAHGLFDEPVLIQPLPETADGAFARTLEEKAAVLLKNDRSTLPLQGITSIAVIGSDADVLVGTGGSGIVTPTYAVPVLDGIRARAGAAVNVQYLAGSDPVTSAALLPGPDIVPSDFLTAAGGVGSGLTATYYLNATFSGVPTISRVDPYAAINGGFFIYGGLVGGSPHFPTLPATLNTTSSIRWTGQLTAPVAGAYVLALTTSGTSRLYVDGALVASTAAATVAGTITTSTAPLTFAAASKHAIRIEFVNDAPQATDAGPQFKFGWTPPAGVVAAQATAAAKLAATADAAIVVVRDYGGEGGDKPSLRLPNGQADVIRQVGAANPRTIVVMLSSGVMQTSDWDPLAGAVLHAWFGGQEQGNAIAALLFGDVNPSGRLPVTIPVDDTHTPVSSPLQFPGVNLVSQFSEGIFMGYRGYESLGIAPQYPFGFGLSYTKFDYANLRTTAAAGSAITATVNVTNSGAVAGTETVQVYAGALSAPVPTAGKALAGFAKVDLQPGEAKDVTVTLDPHSLSYWDVVTHAWILPGGQVPVLVGASSADIRLTGAVSVPAAP